MIQTIDKGKAEALLLFVSKDLTRQDTLGQVNVTPESVQATDSYAVLYVPSLATEITEGQGRFDLPAETVALVTKTVPKPRDPIAFQSAPDEFAVVNPLLGLRQSVRRASSRFPEVDSLVPDKAKMAPPFALNVGQVERLVKAAKKCGSDTLYFYLNENPETWQNRPLLVEFREAHIDPAAVPYVVQMPVRPVV